MAGQTWSITIEPGNAGASFVPDVFGADPTKGLQAQNADLVCWNNRTGDAHQIAIGGTAITDEIAGWSSSTPAYLIQGQTVGGTITYNCTKHDNETGTITVVA
jgi:hypothetical protein